MYTFSRRLPVWSQPDICTRRRFAAEWSPRTGTRIRSPRLPVWCKRYRNRNGYRDKRPGRIRAGGPVSTTIRPRRSFDCCSKRGHLSQMKITLVKQQSQSCDIMCYRHIMHAEFSRLSVFVFYIGQNFQNFFSFKIHDYYKFKLYGSIGGGKTWLVGVGIPVVVDILKLKATTNNFFQKYYCDTTWLWLLAFTWLVNISTLIYIVQ